MVYCKRSDTEIIKIRDIAVAVVTGTAEGKKRDFAGSERLRESVRRISISRSSPLSNAPVRAAISLRLVFIVIQTATPQSGNNSNYALCIVHYALIHSKDVIKMMAMTTGVTHLSKNMMGPTNRLRSVPPLVN